MKTPSGKRKRVCLATKRPPMCIENLTQRPVRKSQFDVWGATISTMRGMSGRLPSIVQPRTPITKRPRAAASGPWARETFGPSSGMCGSVHRAMRDLTSSSGGPRARGRRRTPSRRRARRDGACSPARSRAGPPAGAGGARAARPGASGAISGAAGGLAVDAALASRERGAPASHVRSRSRRSAATARPRPGHRRPVRASSASPRLSPAACVRHAGHEQRARRTGDVHHLDRGPAGRGEARRPGLGAGPRGGRDVPPHAADAEAGHRVERLRVEPRPRGGPANRHGESGRDDLPGGVDAARRGEEPPVADLAHARRCGRRRRGRRGRVRPARRCAIVVEHVEGHVGAVRLGGGGLRDAAALDEHVHVEALGVAAQALVHRRVLAGRVVAGERVEDDEEGDVVEAGEVGEGSVRRQAPALDQHDRRPPGRDVVAERARVPVLVVARHAARHERRHGPRNERAHAPGPRAARRQRALRVAGHREESDRREDAGVAHRRAPVLVVEVEGDLRREAVADRLEETALRGREDERVAIHVDALSVAPRVAGGAVGVQHRDEQQRQPVEDRVAAGDAGEERVDGVEEGGRRRRLVPVHLRPQQARASRPGPRSAGGSAGPRRIAPPLRGGSGRPGGAPRERAAARRGRRGEGTAPRP